MKRYDIVDRHTGEILQEPTYAWNTSAFRPLRRRRKRLTQPPLLDAAIAAGVVLGLWLSCAVMP